MSKSNIVDYTINQQATPLAVDYNSKEYALNTYTIVEDALGELINYYVHKGDSETAGVFQSMKSIVIQEKETEMEGDK